MAYLVQQQLLLDTWNGNKAGFQAFAVGPQEGIFCREYTIILQYIRHIKEYMYMQNLIIKKQTSTKKHYRQYLQLPVGPFLTVFFPLLKGDHSAVQLCHDHSLALHLITRKVHVLQ